MPFYVIGAPAKPYPQSIIDSVTSAVGSVNGIAEAHMPQWFQEGLTQGSEQVLVVVLGKGWTKEQVAPPLIEAMEQALPDGPNILVIPLTGRDGALSTVRETGMQIFNAPGVEPEPKPWWKFW